MTTTTATAGAALEIRDLAKAFVGPRGAVTPVLRSVSLDVAAGKALVVLGSSGSGKTTLLRIIAGLERPDRGELRLDGQRLDGDGAWVPPERRRIGMVFQALELWPHMTVAEHLTFGLPGRPRGASALRDETARRLADAVGLSEALLRRRPDTLSGGERQRVAIARTLAPRPAVILYDEPLANLDPDRRGSLRALIRRLATEEQTTLVYVTHDAEEALEMGDEIAVLASGLVLERGTPEDLYARPRTLAGARALGPVTAIPATWSDPGVETALGRLAVADPARAAAVCGRGPALALLRPEAVTVAEGGAGVAARVEGSHLRGAHWIFAARAGDVAVHGESERRLQNGAQVALRLNGPVAVVAADEEAA